VDAIEGNEPNKAELFMRNHIDAAKRIIIEDVTEAKIFRDGENGTI
jgi:DNA-binding GntR family transcriptional regulator